MRYVIPAVLVALLLFGFVFPVRAAEDPLTWPEPQRAFWLDGPGWLLSEQERARFLAASANERESAINAFLARDPVPETEANELVIGIEKRQAVARELFGSPADVRFQAMFLAGVPLERKVIDCGQAYKPLELWSYGPSTLPALASSEAQSGSGAESETPGAKSKLFERRSKWREEPKLVFYQPVPGEPWQLWGPYDSKTALYNRDMQYLLEQFEELRNFITGRRFDYQACKDARKIDEATGVDGLRGFLKGRPTQAAIESFLKPPADLAEWAQLAAATPAKAVTISPLAVSGLSVQFPRQAGDRIGARFVVSVPVEAPLSPDAEGELDLVADGILAAEGKVFGETRVRFKVAKPDDGASVSLALEDAFRPGLRGMLHLKISDTVSGAVGFVSAGFVVPSAPVEADKVLDFEGAVALGQVLAKEAAQQAADSLMLAAPLEGQVSLMLWRAIALVTGNNITKVTFFVDGAPQLTRKEAPWEGELRLATYPREQVVKVEGYDAAGNVIATDEVILNQPRGAFRVRIVEPKRGSKVVGKVGARAEVVVPDERVCQRVEFRLNNELIATLEKPPWAVEVTVPGGNEATYLSATAYLDDGHQSEDVRFLNSPDFVEEVDVRLVELYTTVLGAGGRFAGGLEVGDFQVLEDGRPQQISKFELVENLPLIVGVTIDTSGSMSDRLAEAQEAGQGFLKKVMTPQDHCFVVAFSGKPTLVMPPTDDVGACTQGLEGLQAVGWTALHDAVVTSLYYLREVEGQRALVLLSDGDDTASGIQWKDALEYARRSGVAVYPIGLGISAIDVAIRRKLSDLASETGGRSFFIDRAEELSGVYAQIESELRSRYLLAYAPDQSDETGAFRQIEVKVKKSGLKARTIRGYYR